MEDGNPKFKEQEHNLIMILSKHYRIYYVIVHNPYLIL